MRTKHPPFNPRMGQAFYRQSAAFARQQVRLAVLSYRAWKLAEDDGETFGILQRRAAMRKRLREIRYWRHRHTLCISRANMADA